SIINTYSITNNKSCHRFGVKIIVITRPVKRERRIIIVDSLSPIGIGSIIGLRQIIIISIVIFYSQSHPKGKCGRPAYSSCCMRKKIHVKDELQIIVTFNKYFWLKMK